MDRQENILHEILDLIPAEKPPLATDHTSKPYGDLLKQIDVRAGIALLARGHEPAEVVGPFRFRHATAAL